MTDRFPLLLVPVVIFPSAQSDVPFIPLSVKLPDDLDLIILLSDGWCLSGTFFFDPICSIIMLFPECCVLSNSIKPELLECFHPEAEVAELPFDSALLFTELANPSTLTLPDDEGVLLMGTPGNAFCLPYPPRALASSTLLSRLPGLYLSSELIAL